MVLRPSQTSTGMSRIGVACKKYYRVYEGDGSLLWQRATNEQSSGIIGSAVFDFEGDGAAEVVYADEEALWVFDGSTGDVEVEWTERNPGTRYEYPTIADVDADGSAEILVPHGRPRPGDTVHGITVLGSGSSTWASRAPSESHAYFMMGVFDDLTIPAAPLPNCSLQPLPCCTDRRADRPQDSRSSSRAACILHALLRDERLGRDVVSHRERCRGRCSGRDDHLRGRRWRRPLRDRSPRGGYGSRRQHDPGRPGRPAAESVRPGWTRILESMDSTA